MYRSRRPMDACGGSNRTRWAMTGSAGMLARDAEDGAFKDYVLGRLSGASLQGQAEAPSSTDQDWHGWVTLTIAPNPGLSAAQKKVIERDYGMRGGTADLKVRKALAYYTKHRLGLDLDPKARRPEDQHVVLVTTSTK